jgi:hypothetical protein
VRVPVGVCLVCVGKPPLLRMLATCVGTHLACPEEEILFVAEDQHWSSWQSCARVVEKLSDVRQLAVKRDRVHNKYRCRACLSVREQQLASKSGVARNVDNSHCPRRTTLCSWQSQHAARPLRRLRSERMCLV